MKFTSIITFLVLVVFLVFSNGVSAQTTDLMPVFYNSAGQAVNTSGGTLPAGTYYQMPGQLGPVTYYGNGTFMYNLTGVFGGSVYNPTGQAGSYTVPAVSTPSVGIPNTGAGGNAISVSIILALSALASVAGLFYARSSKYADSK